MRLAEVVTLSVRWARVNLIVDGSSALSLRYIGLWNPSNRDENIIAIAVRSNHDANLRPLCQIRSHKEHEFINALRLAEHVGL
jgi:hypothetical protein